MINILSETSMIIGVLGNHLLDERVHPINKKDKVRINKLKTQIKKLPQIKKEKSHALSEWNKNRAELRDHILNDNPAAFLSWDVVKRTMVADANIREFFSLLTHRWLDWQKVLTESTIGSGKKYLLFQRSSANQLHNAFHLQHFVSTPSLLKDFGEVIEFGGGYGCMCSLFLRSGFEGKYKIFDLPEFSALQQFYLNSCFPESKTKQIEYFNGPLSNKKEPIKKRKKPSILIATWSLSETDIKTRSAFLSKFDPDVYLLAYQTRFGEVDNNKYFAKFMASKKEFIWKNQDISYLPGNRYSVGVRANQNSQLLNKVQSYIANT